MGVSAAGVSTSNIDELVFLLETGNLAEVNGKFFGEVDGNRSPLVRSPKKCHQQGVLRHIK